MSEGDAEAQKRLGKTAVFSLDGYSLLDNICEHDNTTTAVRTVIVDPFLRDDWKTVRQDLKLGKFRLGKRAQYIEVGCGSAFVLDHDELLIPEAGAFYLASREH